MGGPSRKKRMTTSSRKRPLFYGQGWDRTCGLRVVQNLIYNLERPGHASGYTIPCEKGGERGWMNTLAHGEAQKQRGLGLPTRNWDFYCPFSGNWDMSVVFTAIQKATNNDYKVEQVSLIGQQGLGSLTTIQWESARGLIFNGPHPRTSGPHWWLYLKNFKTGVWNVMDSKDKPHEAARPIPIGRHALRARDLAERALVNNTHVNKTGVPVEHRKVFVVLPTRS